MRNPLRSGLEWQATRHSRNAPVALAFAALLLPPSVHAQAGDTVAASDAGRSALTANSLPTASCSVRYHASLTGDILTKARATQTIADEMRTEIAELPGYWLFWDGNGVLARTAHQQRLLATQQIDEQSNRMCVRSILARGGRIRCLKWQPIPAGYEPPAPRLPGIEPAKPQVTPGERRIAARLGRRVVAKGALAELAKDTALYHVLQRTTDELVAYASQPHHDTICTGASAMVDFYRRKLEPLAKMAADANQMLIETQTAAVAAPSAAAASMDQTATSTTRAGLTSLIHQLLASALDKAELAPLKDIRDPLKLLAATRDILTDQRFKAIEIPLRSRLRKALRTIEFAIYARLSSQRTHRLHDGFNALFAAISEANRQSCTCTN